MHLTGDGPFGREAFRIPLPSGVLVVRSGWWTLRSLTRATTLPVLTRREGRRLVVAVHAPLPDPADDRGEGCSRAAPRSFPGRRAGSSRTGAVRVLASWPDTSTAASTATERTSEATLLSLTTRP